MKKVELLSPVGSKDALYQAIHNGADAVYLAGKHYGARSYADNFTNDELIDAVKYCHLYGVKIYITVNTIIFDNEKEEFLEYIDFLYKINVDALIMQDIGMITIVRNKYPNFEIHASTQMHNHNKYGIKLLEDLGVKRIVYARELSLDEINSIDTSLEKEIFIHGALCVCYSGCCLFSARKSSRSGNRGECIASCRLKYKLLKNDNEINTNGEYLLSTKELNTVDEIYNLLDSGIDSLKIEGRMKSPEYVGFITKIYRNAIDEYYNGNKYKLNEKDLKDMKSLFNREFTTGYLFNKYGKDLMNIKTPNHQGSKLGKVINLNENKIKIHLYEDLSQEDGIRFAISNTGMIINKLYNEKGLLVNKVLKGQNAVIDNKIGLKEKEMVNKTIDKSLIKDLRKYDLKKIKINMKVYAHIDNNLKLIVTDGINTIEEIGVVVSKSINRPLSNEDIIKQLSKLGNTPFIIDEIEINKDENIFIPNGDLNEIRRNCINKLISLRENIISHKDNFKFELDYKLNEKEQDNLNVLVRNEEQLKACLEEKVKNIYITDYDLYKKYKNKNIYYVLDRVTNNEMNYEDENLLVRELGGIEKYSKNNNVVSDYTLNVVNSESAKFMISKNVKRVCYSPEVDISNIVKINLNNELIVYGRPELMITKYCMLNMILNDDNKKCGLCKKNDKYILKDEKNNKYPIYHDKCITTIYDNVNIDLINKIDLVKEKFNNIRINLLDESYEETIKLIQKFRG